MTGMSMDWFPADPSLEPLRPLSPEILDHEEFQNLGIDVDKLTRSEIAGKLLAHLDDLHQEETEPFDWYSNEKSIDIPTFDPVPSPTPYKPESTVNEIHDYAFLNNSPTYESTTLPPANGYDTTTQLPPKYAPQPTQYEVTEKKVTSSAPQHSGAIVPDFDIEGLKAETLTPPDSPKDDDLYELLKTFEPAMIEQLMAGTNEFESPEFDEKSLKADAACEKSFSADELPESGCSSPCDVSDSGLDDQEWTPPSSVRRASRCSRSSGITGASRRRNNTKPYSKPPVEERKQRKKEQNKNAATRYRLKKKAEVEEIKFEEQKLIDENKKLKTQLEDITREVRCLKSLMRDVYRKKVDELSDTTSDSNLWDGSDSEQDYEVRTSPISVRAAASTCTRNGNATAPKRSRAEERKQRKREQNKGAATRYRLRKRAEYEKIKSKEVKLRMENRKLKRRLKDIVGKIQSLKLSMRQFYSKIVDETDETILS